MTARVYVGPSFHADRIVGWGQSLLFADITAADFPAELKRGTGVPYVNQGFPGFGWAGLASAGFVTLLLKQPIAANNIMVCLGGMGDILDAATGEQTYDLLAGQVIQARAAGFDHVVGCTHPPLTGMSGGEETERQAYNAMILDDPDDVFDGLTVDVAADPLDDFTDLTYFDADQIHWNAAGAALGAERVRAVLLPLLT